MSSVRRSLGRLLVTRPSTGPLSARRAQVRINPLCSFSRRPRSAPIARCTPHRSGRAAAWTYQRRSAPRSGPFPSRISCPIRRVNKLSSREPRAASREPPCCCPLYKTSNRFSNRRPARAHQLSAQRVQPREHPLLVGHQSAEDGARFPAPAARPGDLRVSCDQSPRRSHRHR